MSEFGAFHTIPILVLRRSASETESNTTSPLQYLEEGFAIQ
jgi:hypothetical protein